MRNCLKCARKAYKKDSCTGQAISKIFKAGRPVFHRFGRLGRKRALRSGCVLLTRENIMAMYLDHERKQCDITVGDTLQKERS